MKDKFRLKDRIEKTEDRGQKTEDRILNSTFCILYSVFCILVLCLVFCVCQSRAVSSKIIRQASSSDLLKGQTENVIIGSRGTIQLGRAPVVLVEKFKDVWSINSIVVSGGTIYIGTSPNGGIYKYSLNKLTKIYPPDDRRICPAEQKDSTSSQKINSCETTQSAEEDKPQDANTIQDKQLLLNEHIFAMAIDVTGRLLAGISGEKCKLCRLESSRMETIFEPNSAEGTKYIFAITIDQAGDIYLGTGPQGKVYRLDPLGKKAELVYHSRDKNILSFSVAPDGSIYAGSDSRGLVYKINPQNKTATVLYDSDQPEITALLSAKSPPWEENFLYAAATSAEIVRSEEKFAAQLPKTGRPEAASKNSSTKSGDDGGGLTLEIANTKEPDGDKSAKRETPPRERAKPSKASFIYKINKEGFVTDIFSETAVFLCLAEQDCKLLIGTGNKAQLFAVDPATEQQAVIYEDKQASQITAIAVTSDVAYIGTANQAKLIMLSKTYAKEGAYISEPLDAGQPAKWGNLQIEGDIPQGCKVLMACRSGNVEDVNDPAFSAWTEPVEVTKPVQLQSPLGRFCQYKLLLQSPDGLKTPLIREIALASTVPNLAPNVESVTVGRIEATGKAGIFKITYTAKDDNDDKLIYKIDFRKVPRVNWIEIKDKHEENSLEWDGKTAEDGKYEIRIIASDERSNTPATKLTGSRVSDPVIVDNTGPVIGSQPIEKTDKTITLKLQVHDELSVIGELHYTVDSNAEWKGAMPDDFVCDTKDENFTIVIEDLKPGEHTLTVRARDSVGNTTYKTFEVNVD